MEGMDRVPKPRPPPHAGQAISLTKDRHAHDKESWALECDLDSTARRRRCRGLDHPRPRSFVAPRSSRCPRSISTDRSSLATRPQSQPTNQPPPVWTKKGSKETDSRLLVQPCVTHLLQAHTSRSLRSCSTLLPATPCCDCTSPHPPLDLP